MAKRKQRKGKRGMMGRSEIPYAQRLRMQQYDAVKYARDYSAKITMFCKCIALHELHGIGYKRLVRYSLIFKDLIDEFYEDTDVGMARAVERMKQHGIEIPVELPSVPVPGLSAREQQQHAHAVQASYVAHLVGLIAINEAFGFGKDKLEGLSARSAELAERFDREGDGFLFEEMEKIGFPVADGHVLAYVDENNEPVTQKKWLEDRK